MAGIYFFKVLKTQAQDGDARRISAWWGSLWGCLLTGSVGGLCTVCGPTKGGRESGGHRQRARTGLGCFLSSGNAVPFSRSHLNLSYLPEAPFSKYHYAGSWSFKIESLRGGVQNSLHNSAFFFIIHFLYYTINPFQVFSYTLLFTYKLLHLNFVGLDM